LFKVHVNRIYETTITQTDPKLVIAASDLPELHAVLQNLKMKNGMVS